jgi:hypothetical protein
MCKADLIASPGLDPGVQVFISRGSVREDVDGRIKSGQGDGEVISLPRILRHRNVATHC